MDRLNNYQTIIHRLITRLAERYGISDDDAVEQVVVIDDTHGVYQIYTLGWEGHERVNTPWLHVRLKNGKFWIEDDWTEPSIADALLEAGVPNHDIVLAINPPDMRQYTDFAIA
jgi:hypothetical protein